MAADRALTTNNLPIEEGHMGYLDTKGKFEDEIKRGALHIRSKRLDHLVAAIDAFIKSPKRSRLMAITSKLDEWKQQDPKEFADRGKNNELALRNETNDRLAKWGQGEIGIVDANDHPRYEPVRWNDNSVIQWSTNCYAYACNDPQDHQALSKPQPGQFGGGAVREAEESAVRYAVMRDDLIRSRMQLQRLVPLIRLRGEDVPEHVVNVPGYYLIALVTAPNADYHWARQDNNGMWSHKPGWGKATNLDHYGQPIYDPREATFAINIEPDPRKPPVYMAYEFTTFYYCPRNGVRTGDLGSLGSRRGSISGKDAPKPQQQRRGSI